MSHVSSGNDSNQATKIQPRSCWEVAPIIASQQDDDVSPGITLSKAKHVLRVATLVLEDTVKCLYIDVFSYPLGKEPFLFMPVTGTLATQKSCVYIETRARPGWAHKPGEFFTSSQPSCKMLEKLYESHTEPWTRTSWTVFVGLNSCTDWKSCTVSLGKRIHKGSENKAVRIPTELRGMTGVTNPWSGTLTSVDQASLLCTKGSAAFGPTICPPGANKLPRIREFSIQATSYPTPTPCVV